MFGFNLRFPAMPAAVQGFVPTMNCMGFMTSSLDPYSQQFIDHAAACRREVLDLGAAYGVATIPALARGAKVVACDMDLRHLEVLRSRVPSHIACRLSTVVGLMPDAVDFEPGRFEAILVSRVLHFMDISALEKTMRKLANWLAPGGKLYIVEDTPYLANTKALIPVYEERKQQGLEWPGMMTGVQRARSQFGDQCPDIFHFFDEDTLRKLAESNALVVKECKEFARHDYPESIRLDGREGIGLIAQKPFL